jgi:NAD-dependent DNA ligase
MTAIDILIKKLKSPDVIFNLSIPELESIIAYTADIYYNTGKSVISDNIYDILIDCLQFKSPKSKILKSIGAKVRSKNKVKLDYWLGSMDKIKTPQQLIKYPPPFNISDKLDGVSALLLYKFNGTINLYTRGTASEGTDITPLIKYLNLPDFDTISNFCKHKNIKGENNLIAFRGELIMKKEIFNKKWSHTKNARNTVSGLVNSKKINPELAKDTDFVLYEIVDPFYNIKYNLINTLNFNIVHNFIANSYLSFDYLSEYLKKRRIESIYQIDGIIITSMNIKKRNIVGNPDYAFAYKDISETKKTIVESIEWNVSKDGYIKPIVIIRPVSLGGVIIERTSGFNAKYIVDNILGPGAEIELIRSGDVIPYIKTVLKPASNNKPDLPKSKWHWNESKVDIIIDNIDTNIDVLIKNIYFFFSTLDAKGVGIKNISKLVNAGFNTIPKILNLKIDDDAQKSMYNLLTSIKKSVTNVPLYKLMAASNKLGHGLGEEKIKQVLTTYPNLLQEYKKWPVQEFINNIKKINGWEEKTASLLVSNFDNFMDFFESIKKYVTIKKIEVINTNINKIFVGEKDSQITFVFTGFRDKSLEELIQKNGGKITTTISKKTNYLVVKDSNSINNKTDKIIKAEELNIKIITKDQLIKLL